uniref:Signal peptide peptidase-like n=1 Tax=Tetraselmis sp. GSL018 TaxID=582737 RepID=A0A061QZ01_9CHLO
MSKTTDLQQSLPCPKIHLALLCWSLLPTFLHVNPNLNVVVTASLAVLTGSWRSVKPTPVPLQDRMSKQDAVRMPIVGSVVLFSLFVMFTFLPKDLVNLCLSGYFVLLGTFAISGTVLPFVEPLFPKARARSPSGDLPCPPPGHPIPSVCVWLPAEQAMRKGGSPRLSCLGAGK